MSDHAPAHTHSGLLRILGVGFGIAVAIGAVIGSGILRAPSAVAVEVGSPALILGLWLFGGIQAVLSANMIAELGSAIPRSGGIYTLAHRAFGEFGGLLVGWSDWLSTIAANAAASVSFAEFFALIVPQASGHKIAVALALQFAVYAANLTGLRQGRSIQLVTSFLKSAMLFVFIVAAVLVAAPGEPKLPPLSASAFSLAGAVLAYKLIFGAYAGWTMPVNFSGENVDAARSIPRAMFLGIAVTTVLFVGINAALLYSLGPSGVAASPLPFSSVLARFGGTFPAVLFALGAMITVASCANAQIMGAPRVLYALANDGLLPRVFSSVNKGGTPSAALLMCAVFSVGLALSGGFVFVFGLIATLNTAATVIVEIGFFRLRLREPDLPRPYRAVLYPWLPALGLAVDTTVVALIAYADHLGVAVALGLAVLCVPLAMLARRARKPVLAGAA